MSLEAALGIFHACVDSYFTHAGIAQAEDVFTASLENLISSGSAPSGASLSLSRKGHSQSHSRQLAEASTTQHLHLPTHPRPTATQQHTMHSDVATPPHLRDASPEQTHEHVHEPAAGQSASSSAGDSAISLSRCALLNATVCGASVSLSARGEGVLVAVYNPLAWPREELVRVPISQHASKGWSVTGGQHMLRLRGGGTLQPISGLAVQAPTSLVGCSLLQA